MLGYGAASVRFSVLLVAGSCVAWTARAVDQSRAIDLLEALRTADSSSPLLKQDRFHEEALGQDVEAQKAGYLPELSAAAVASNGDPGSFALFGVNNNISATERMGAGGALVIKQDIWDFGRTWAVRAAEANRELQKNQRSLSRAQVEREVLTLYVHAPFQRAETENAPPPRSPA